ncbi:S8 family serine peptidase [Clostridium sp. UBA5988]|uniref:S8 family serine peptidase n=1 Tax=Clostridium sp. UBA5988 TaxID=1946369 RepID=UPI003216D1B1
MSDFTSWGTSPDLRFKPEVTAPGGQIYSTVNDNRYESMSGTSMAAPHAAGGVALVVQYLKSKKVELKGREFVNLAKTLLINTAKPQIEKETNLSYLTRRQGAGLVQIYDAIKTNVSAVDQKGGAAIALGELKNENKFTLKENWAWDGTLFNDRTGMSRGLTPLH